MFENPILREEIYLLDQIADSFNSFPKKTYKNGKNKCQSAVTMIFRFNPKIFEKDSVLAPTHYDLDNEKHGFLNLMKKNDKLKSLSDDLSSGLEILFIKRADNPRDRHSGQVAFPGGKCEDEEDDFTAAVREAEEEIGISLGNQQEYAYLGKFPRNFYVYATRKGKLYVSIHVFFQLNLRDTPVKMNPGEIAEIFWVPFRFFLNANLQNLQNTDIVKFDFSARFPQGKIISPIVKACTKGLESAVFRHMKLPNQSFLWGLTFGFVIYFLGFAGNLIKANADNFKTFDSHSLGYIVNNGLKYDLIYNQNPSFMRVRKWLVETVYNAVRVRPFEAGKKNFDFKLILLFLLVVLGPIVAITLPKL